MYDFLHSMIDHLPAKPNEPTMIVTHRYKRITPQLPEGVTAKLQAVAQVGYDKKLARAMNSWQMHQRATNAMHHHTSQADCFKCQSCIQRVDKVAQECLDIIEQNHLTADSFVLLSPPADIIAELAAHGASVLDGTSPVPDLNHKPWAEDQIHCAGTLTPKQQNVLNRWYGHCHNIHADHLRGVEDCGGCNYIIAEFRYAFGLNGEA